MFCPNQCFLTFKINFMKYLILGLLSIGLCMACTETESEEGLIGEWEGTTERVNSKGELVDVNVSCTIKSLADSKRNVKLAVSSVSYEFEATEEMDAIIYMDSPVQNDTTGKSFVSGSAVLLYDTLLRFEHMVYEMEKGALLYSNEEMFDMVRK